MSKIIIRIYNCDYSHRVLRKPNSSTIRGGSEVRIHSHANIHQTVLASIHFERTVRISSDHLRPENRQRFITLLLSWREWIHRSKRESMRVANQRRSFPSRQYRLRGAETSYNSAAMRVGDASTLTRTP